MWPEKRRSSMGKKLYLKLCTECLRKFGSGANGNCPYCGSTDWRHLDSDDGVVPPPWDARRRIRVVEGIPLENGDVMVMTRTEAVA
jgi:hypothetical protein